MFFCGLYLRCCPVALSPGVFLRSRDSPQGSRQPPPTDVDCLHPPSLKLRWTSSTFAKATVDNSTSKAAVDKPYAETHPLPEPHRAAPGHARSPRSCRRSSGAPSTATASPSPSRRARATCSRWTRDRSIRRCTGWRNRSGFRPRGSSRPTSSARVSTGSPQPAAGNCCPNDHVGKPSSTRWPPCSRNHGALNHEGQGTRSP